MNLKRTGTSVFSKNSNLKTSFFNKSLNASFKINGKLFKSLNNYNSTFNDRGNCNELTMFLNEWFNEKKHIALETSGSTGSPKKIKIKKTVMIDSAKNTAKFFGLREGDRALLCLPIKYIAGKMMIVRSIVIGLNLCTTESNGYPLKKTSDNYDFAAMVPNQVEKNINYISKIKILLIGGAPISNTLSKLFQSKTNSVYETFGMTETASHVAVKNLSAGEKTFNAMPGVSFDSKTDLLIINAPHLNKNKILTNDIVELKSKKSFIWKGRKDFVVNSGGIKYFPEMIEKKITVHEDCKFVICGVPDPVLFQKIAIVFEQSKPKNTKEMFRELTKYERPKYIFCLKKFQRTNGKINRNMVQKQVLKIFNEN